ncbi:diaminopimelate epimerase [Peribacillus sp. SCS-155]|uniref:diaminopimelate epimerase n=1 Tax=Peribacillus sedimenti TaxID=3115297 RepID=UPI003905B88E
MNLEILKCHGSGNDFLIIDELTKDISFSDQQRADLAQSLCNRNGALGADGILFVLKSDSCDARMRVFNADGSEASMCGNGLRCVARYVYEVTGKEQMKIETMKVDLSVEHVEDIYIGIPTFKVEISPVSFDVADLPLNIAAKTLVNEKLPELSGSLAFTAVAVPNPHLIAIVETENIHSDIQERISRKVNSPNDLFPDGVNVSFVKALGQDEIYVRTFERGVGFTNACGTAMSASSLVTCIYGMNKEEKAIDVYNNGGKVRCIVHRLHSDGDRYFIDLIGNATYVYKASVEVDPEEPDHYTLLTSEPFDRENQLYEEFQVQVKSYLERHL